MLPLGISYRRALLDAELERLGQALGGVVLDVGGRRIPRGRFVPPVVRCRCWAVINLEPAERPDVAGDATALPIRSGVADAVLCIEVLQYVGRPEAAAAEMARVLAPGGTALVTAPLLHRADAPTDRHRFTQVRLRELLEGAGLTIVACIPQGFFFTTLANFLRQAAASARGPARYAAAALVIPAAGLLVALDRLPSVQRSPFLSSFTTGFLVVARKP